MFVFERASPYEVMFEVTVDGKLEAYTQEAPRVMLEHEFMSLVQQAARYPKPVKVKMSRKVPIYDPFDKTTIEREHSVEFTNQAWNERN